MQINLSKDLMMILFSCSIRKIMLILSEIIMDYLTLCFHIQALAASELIHLLKADVLQATTEAEQERDITEELQTNRSLTERKSEDNN